MPPDTLISFLIAQSAASTKLELLDFFDYDENTLSESAFNHFLAVDGTTVTFFSHDKFSSEHYFAQHGRSAKGIYSMHLNALYDLQNCTYQDAIIQPVRQKNEYLAFANMVDRYPYSPSETVVFIADRGYCSYNNFAHVIENNACFLIRSKDITSKGILRNFSFPKDQETFDVNIDVTVVRSDSKKIKTNTTYRRKVDKNATFDFISEPHGTYELSFRVVRFPISDNAFEAIITNLDRDQFPPDAIKALYHQRWTIESSFRELKYTIGLSNFHAYKPELVKQEIFAKLIAYNLTRIVINLF